MCKCVWWAFLWLKWAGLPPAVLGSSILSKGVETGPTATQFGLACAHTISCLPGTRLRRAKHGAFLQFLLQKELFSSFCRKRNFNMVLILCFCHRSNFSPVSTAKRNFSPVSATRLTFLLCSKTFCCAIKLPVVQ